MKSQLNNKVTENMLRKKIHIKLLEMNALLSMLNFHQLFIHKMKQIHYKAIRLGPMEWFQHALRKLIDIPKITATLQ